MPLDFKVWLQVSIYCYLLEFIGIFNNSLRYYINFLFFYKIILYKKYVAYNFL